MAGLVDPLRVAALPTPIGGEIGITFCPGHRRPDGESVRELAEDLPAIRDWGAVAILTLMEQQELDRYGVAGLGEAAERLGMEWHHCPIIDNDAPRAPFASRWVYSGPRLRAHLAQGRKVLVHCLGGMGRAGTVSALLLIDMGMQPEAAIAAVRAARPGAIESPVQESFVRAAKPIGRGADARADRLLGCLLGGAVGDGFGYAIEFDRLPAIRARFGAAGLREPVLHEGRLVVSDDTQMTLFTLEGAARALAAGGGDEAVIEEIRLAYLDWLGTQRRGHRAPSGALARQAALRQNRAPGNTCLSALAEGGGGTPDQPINDSKGCGGAMRSAPVGFLPAIDPERAFELGARSGALTHGHPDGWAPSGLVAAIVRQLRADASFADAIAGGIVTLDGSRLGGRARPVTEPYRLALSLAGQGGDHAQAVARLGEGWVGDEAVAIAAYSVLAAQGFEDAIAIAANHDGDSDSTASIAGQFWGARYGIMALPHAWVRRLDVFDPLLDVAGAFLAQASGQAGDA